MAKYATGKHARAISDRSGLEFPYREMVREWLDQNLATIAKEVINEALDKLSKNARN